ncbi:diguanylate cyclase (GGDEF)-like protein [Breoghania corrubedonensis]|uniref:Diguanylate cyclase (GGDEF)-like protein n=1 Tax=Breoghania corrubedonensis TaxID=665038 RepID=A0A2T5VF76_9HYPH|nr:EAL domain-containing protein [Breoghania corrubedonensis]PTW62390.1 diguanylate cyclase (GGDEF)-like protein [Breoghania corrubedonensis]
MSIRHRLNIIIVTLFSALLISLCVLGMDMRRDLARTTAGASRLGQLSDVWDVIAIAALHPDEPARASGLAGTRRDSVAADTELSALRALLDGLAQANTVPDLLKRAREGMPAIADPMEAGGAVNGQVLRLSRLVTTQLPEMLWRLTELRADTHALALRDRLDLTDRMRFLVNAGQFKAAADAIDTAFPLHPQTGRKTALQQAMTDFSRASLEFRQATEALARKINVASASEPFLTLKPRPLDAAYAGLAEASVKLQSQAFARIANAIDGDISSRRWTMLGVAAVTILATLLALSLALSLSSSIVRAIAALEGRIRSIADGGDDDPRVPQMPQEEEHSELFRITRAVIDCRDRVAERVAAAAQDEKRRDLELIFEGNPLPLILHDPQTTCIVAVNSTAVEHYGYCREEFTRLCIADLRAPACAIVDGPYDGNAAIRHCKADGEMIEVLPFEREIRYDGRQIKLTTIVDITARRRAEARLAFLAHFDPLTQLANRVLLQKKLAEEIRRGGEREGYRFSLLCLDLDRFKMVNDTLGHDAGDRVLRTVADRLSALVEPGDTVARLGGDEFTLLICGPNGPQRADGLAEMVCGILSEPCTIDGARLALGGSVGVSHYPEHGRCGDDLMKHADLAQHQAKTEGRGRVCVFEPSMDEALRQRQTLETDLREALELHRLELHYQPLIDMKTNIVSGFEALVRWNDPVRGQVPPGKFIPIAEEVGLIEEIGTWVLNEACREVAGWPNGVKVAVNVSSYQIRSGNMVRRVREALDASGLAPHRLELEITESVLLIDSAATIRTLHEIRDLGVRIAMDDFGTGYSSLSYLRAFPFDKVKIDQSFVADLGNTAEANAIIRAIAGLSSELGMTTTAEGIETEDQLRYIRAHGCTQAQGFLTGRPVPAKEARIYAAGEVETLHAVLEHMREAEGESDAPEKRAVLSG